MALTVKLKAIAQSPGGVLWWRSVWEGTHDYRYGSGARCQARRRRQILAGTLNAPNGLQGGIEAIVEARNIQESNPSTGRAIEFPTPGFLARLRNKLLAA